MINMGKLCPFYEEATVDYLWFLNYVGKVYSEKSQNLPYVLALMVSRLRSCRKLGQSRYPSRCSHAWPHNASLCFFQNTPPGVARVQGTLFEIGRWIAQDSLGNDEPVLPNLNLILEGGIVLHQANLLGDICRVCTVQWHCFRSGDAWEWWVPSPLPNLNVTLWLILEGGIVLHQSNLLGDTYFAVFARGSHPRSVFCADRSLSRRSTETLWHCCITFRLRGRSRCSPGSCLLLRAITLPQRLRLPGV